MTEIPTQQNSRPSGAVSAFVALAEQAVQRLVADEKVAEEFRSALRSSGQGDLARLETAQRALARVLAHDRFACGDGLRGSDLRALLDRGGLDLEDELRLVYEFTLSGGRSWPALAEASQEAASAEAGRSALLCALDRLTSPGRRPSDVSNGPGDSFVVSRATTAARTSPLGVCRLALELADASPGASGDASELEHWVILLDDPFLRREFGPRLADLRARAVVYLADRARRSGRLEACDDWISSLPDLVSAGTGEAELRARVEELHAGRALAANERGEALARLGRAEAILRQLPGSPDAWHHRLELRLKRAHVLSGDPSTRTEALGVLEGELQETGRTGALDPSLHRRLVLAAARVELDLARQSVAEAAADSVGDPADRDELDSGPGRPGTDLLVGYAAAWGDQAERLRRVHRRLQEAEDLFRHADEEERAVRAWCLGQSLLLDDRVAAAEMLREAIARFRDLGDPARADRVSLDLMVCGVLAGVLGDDADEEFRSEPLRLLRDLARDAAARE